jgi:hypothetical protein
MEVYKLQSYELVMKYNLVNAYLCLYSQRRSKRINPVGCML